MNKEMLCEKLKNHFKDLVALVEQELGEEQMKAIMKIIYLNSEDSVEDIVYDNKFYYHCDEYDFKPFSKQSLNPSPKARWQDAFSSIKVVPKTKPVFDIGESLFTSATSPK